MNDDNAPKWEFRGVWIRASLWRRLDITWFEKCLVAEIDSLGECCWASNGYLAQMMGSTPGNIANALTKLRQVGLVRDLAFNGRVRRLVVDASVSSDPAAAFTPGLNQPSPLGEGSLHPLVNKDTKGEGKASDEALNGSFTDQLQLKSGEITKTPTIAQKAVELWNRFCPDLDPVQNLTTARKNAISAILRPRQWNLATLQGAFRRVHDSDFLCGRVPGKTWKADFTWVMQEENFTRILEGNFRNQGLKATTAEQHEKGF